MAAVVLGENSAWLKGSKVHGNEYKPGDQWGKPTGQKITDELIKLESMLIASTLVNRSNKEKKSIAEIASARGQYHGYGPGSARLKAFKASADNSRECWMLKLALGVVQDIAATGPTNKEFLFFHAVLQPNQFVSPLDEGEARVGGTDFRVIF